MGVFKQFIDGFYNLLVGLGVTARRLPERAVTLQYPDERFDVPERSRGIVVLLSDKETGELNCTACMLCMRACPTAAITIERDKNENNKWYAKSFVVDNTICCFCGLCEEACNFDAIKMDNRYEFATFNQTDLVWDVKKLQEMGRETPYTPTKKTKPAPKPAAAPNPAAKPAGEGAAKTEERPAAPKATQAEEKVPDAPQQDVGKPEQETSAPAAQNPGTEEPEKKDNESQSEGEK